MLNRIYIIFGLLAIVLLVGAFVVPGFVDWSNFRDRMEALAVEALGTDVEIVGEIDFTLLPQPRMEFDEVIVGPAEDPVMTVARVEAHFSLLDFLRDRYFVQRLVLTRPEISLRVNAGGELDLPLDLPDAIGSSNVAIENAQIEQGTIRLTDSRNNSVWRINEFAGNLQLGALRGPFALQGTAVFQENPLNIRLTTSAMNDTGAMTLTGFVRPEQANYSLALDGRLQTGASPVFSGDLVWRRPAAAEVAGDDASGDFVLQARFEARTDKIVFTNYTIIPDENRSGTRLTGVASIRFGERPDFDALITGGVVALAPRDATDEDDQAPFEFVRLLQELPVPPMPPIPGSIGVEIAELDLRAFSIRELGFDASTDGEKWTIDAFTGRLPGNTSVTLLGDIGIDAGMPVFEGTIDLSTRRLDTLAQIWRRPTTNNPLFNMSGRLKSGVLLGNQTLRIEDAQFELDGVTNDLSATISFGEAPRLEVAAAFGELNATQSRALTALLPPVGRTSHFERSFRTGEFDLTAERATIFDLPGAGLAAEGSWNTQGTSFSRLAARDLGGARLDLSGRYVTASAAPLIIGAGNIGLSESPGAPALDRLFDYLRIGAPYDARLRAALPADFSIEVSEPAPEGGQSVAVEGSFGAANARIVGDLAGGFLGAVTGALQVVGSISGEDPDALAEQLGLGEVSVLPANVPATIDFSFEGAPLNSLEVAATARGGDDWIQYVGSMIVSDPGRLRGRGTLNFELSDPGPLASFVGADGIYVPAIGGTSEISYDGTGSFELDGLSADAGPVHVTGNLSRAAQGSSVLIGGDLQIGTIDLNALAALAGGASATLPGDGLWPDGPFAPSTERHTRGRINVDIARIDLSPTDRLTSASTIVSWDETNHRMSGFSAGLGAGKVLLNLSLCCAGVATDRTLSGNITLSGVALDDVLPEIPAGVLDGTLDASASFEGTGQSFDGVAEVLAGQGSFTIRDLEVLGFGPSAFPTLANNPDIIEMEPDTLTTLVSMALEQGTLSLPELSGVFTLAGGTIRTSNLAATSADARLVGGLDLAVPDLGLDGAWSLSPVGIIDPDNLITESTSRVTMLIGGTLFRPETELDVQSMVDAIQVRAFELEVERLERLRAEDEARARAAAEERARLMELEAQRQAEEEARRALEEGTLQQEELDALDLGADDEPGGNNETSPFPAPPEPEPKGGLNSLF